jgi:putative transposase
MRRGQKTSLEQVLLKLRQIEVQTAQGKSLALACKEVEISEQLRERVPAPGNLLLVKGGADCDRAVEEHLQPRPAAIVPGLPAACACQLPGSGLPATRGGGHAVASHSARSKIPIRPVSRQLVAFWRRKRSAVQRMHRAASAT